MSVTVTGSKYGALAISSISNVNRVQVGTTPFVSGDFVATAHGGRIVGLWSASAAAFKGIAWVRRWISTSVLELERPFIDPCTGAVVTQAVGDVAHVSKNWTEIATTGIAVDGDRVTVTDSINWGTEGVKDSICFYDEHRHVRFNQLSIVNFVHGGLVCQGHLEDYASSRISGGCSWSYATTVASWNFIRSSSVSSGNASFLFYGGAMYNYDAAPSYSYVGAQPSNDYASFVMDSVRVYGVDIVSKSNGGVWTDGTRHVVKNCTNVCGNGSNSILFRWANGVAEGNSFKFTRYNSLPLSVFGSDSVGTFTIGSPADSRIIIGDAGDANALWRIGGNGAQTINYTNVVTVTQLLINSGGSQTQSFKFKDTLSNLVTGSVCAIELNSDRSIVDSVLSSSASWAGVVDWDNLVVTSRTGGYPKGPWTYGIKKYGYAPVSAGISATTVDFGAAGTATNVTWSQAVVQSPDINITLSLAAAQALTTLTTLDQVYDAVIAWGTASVARIQVPSLGAYPVSADGSAIDFGAYDIVFDDTAATTVAIVGNTITLKSAAMQPGVKFVRIITTGTVSITDTEVIGTSYTDSTGTIVPLLVTGTRAGTKVRIVRTDTEAELAIGTAGASGFLASIAYTTDLTIRADTVYVNGLDAEKEASAVGSLTISGATLTIVQTPCSIYEGNAVDGSTVTGITLDDINIEADADELDNELTVQEFYAWYKYQLMSDAGIRAIYGAVAAPSSKRYTINVGISDLHIHNIDVVNTLMITGGVIERSDGTSIRKAGPTATHGSIEMLPQEVYVADNSTPAEIAAAVGTHEISTGWSNDRVLRKLAALSVSKTSGNSPSGGTVVFRNLDDTGNEMSATVDANGNRTAVTQGP